MSKRQIFVKITMKMFTIFVEQVKTEGPQFKYVLVGSQPEKVENHWSMAIPILCYSGLQHC